jgi:hypothetical protein
MWRLWPLEGATSSYGASLTYRIESPSGVQPVARFTWSTRGDIGVSTDYHDIGLLVGLGYVIPFSLTAARVELLAGYEHLFQANWRDQQRHTSGFDYLAMLGVDFIIDNLLIRFDLGAGGRIFQVIDEGWVHRLDLQVLAGVGWKWGGNE